MKYVKWLFYLVVVLLILTIIKAIINRQAWGSSYFFTVVISNFQFLVLISWGLVALFWILDKKYFHFHRPVLAASLFLTCTLTFLEGLATFLLKKPEKIPFFLKYAYSYYYNSSEERLIQYEARQSVYDPTLFYKLKPDTAFYFRNPEFNNYIRTNSLGLRDDEASLKGPGIICLGDSFTMGWGVEQEDSYPQQLEKISGIKTLNTGMASYGTAREIASLQHLDVSAMKYLVIQYCFNDEDENKSCLENDGKLRISSAANYDSLVSSHTWSRKYFPGKHFLSVGQLFIKTRLKSLYHLPPLYEDIRYNKTQEKEQAKAFLDVLYQSKINFNKVVVVVTLLDTYKHMQAGFLEYVKQFQLQEPYKTHFADFRVVNMAELVQEEDYYSLDPHLKKSGNRKVAMAIWDALK